MYQIGYMENFRDNLRKLIKEKGLKQMEIAKHLNKNPRDSDRQRISKIIHNRVSPSLDEAVQLSDLLGVDIDYLLGNTGIPNKDIQCISETLGLSEAVVRKLYEYNNTPSEYNFKRLSSINEMLNSESGLKLIESIVNFVHTDFIESIFADTKRGTHSVSNAVFTSVSGTMAASITKEELSNVFLLSIIKLIWAWKEHTTSPEDSEQWNATHREAEQSESGKTELGKQDTQSDAIPKTGNKSKNRSTGKRKGKSEKD